MNPDNLVVGKIYYDKHHKILIEFVRNLNEYNHLIFKNAFGTSWTYHRDVIEFQVIPYTNMLKSYLDINNAP